MTSMENDLVFMDHTEKIVAEMLKSALAPNGIHKCPNGLNVDETIEYVFIDETGEKLQNAANNEINGETAMFETNENDSDEVTMEMGRECENPNLDYANMSDLESLISDGLDKIRLEYPMYPVTAEAHTCNNYHNTPVSVVNAPSHMDNTFENMNTPYNDWYGNTMSARNDACCSPMYQNEANRCIYGERYWENTPYNSNNTSFNWTSSNGSLLNATNNEAEANTTQVSPDCYEDIEAEIVSDENDDEDVDTLASSSKVSNKTQTEATVHCIRTKHDMIEAEVTHLNVNNNLNGISGVSTSTGEGATAHVQICANTPTAIHAAQSTTTTTTTSAAFGVLHQQTSCTTTNFVPNTLANAVLATTPAALYAQSILTSTAHQYLNVFRKEIQQFFTNNINYNTGAQSLNLGFYERLLYAQLLQQQILQQQQQQVAIASLLQQQKIAMQNNAANVAAAAAAAATVASATYSNISVPTTAPNVPSSSNNMDNTSFNNNGDFSTNSTSSLNRGISQNTNKDIGNNIVADMPEKTNFDEEYNKSILE